MVVVVGDKRDKAVLKRAHAARVETPRLERAGPSGKRLLRCLQRVEERPRAGPEGG